jgi:hypothetical protein
MSTINTLSPDHPGLITLPDTLVAFISWRGSAALLNFRRNLSK